jgi:hypothetical protein
MNAFASRSMRLAAAAVAACLPIQAARADTCYGFEHQADGAEHAVGAPPIDIGVGRVQVRELVLEGRVHGTDQRGFKSVGTQAIAGGTAPEMHARNVAVQMLPREPVQQIRLRFSHRPGAEGARAAMVEVNGVRHEWRGSFGQLDGQTLGPPDRPAMLQVRTPAAVPANGWISGTLRVFASGGIQSLTIGSAELRLDDLCFERDAVP